MRAAALRKWATHEVKQLRQLALAGLPLLEIAAQLRRSPSSIRNKALMHGIPLRMRRC